MLMHNAPENRCCSLFSLWSQWPFFLILSHNSSWILNPLKLPHYWLRASSNTKYYWCNTALMFIVELMIKHYFSTDKKFQTENLIASFLPPFLQTDMEIHCGFFCLFGWVSLNKGFFTQIFPLIIIGNGIFLRWMLIWIRLSFSMEDLHSKISTTCSLYNFAALIYARVSSTHYAKFVRIWTITH